MRVLIADGEGRLQDELERLRSEAGYGVMGTVGTAAGLRRKVDLTRPDVAIVDIRMPPTHTDEGLVAARELGEAHPQLGVLVLSHYLSSGYAMRLIEEHP